MFFCVGCWWNQRALLRRKKAELPRQTHTHSPNFSKVTDGGFIKKTAARLRLCRFFISKLLPPSVLVFKPCRIRKAFSNILDLGMQIFVKSDDFTHYGCRHILKKEYKSNLVSKLPLMDLYSFFTACLVEAKKMEVTGLEPVTLCL